MLLNRHRLSAAGAASTERADAAVPLDSRLNAHKAANTIWAEADWSAADGQGARANASGKREGGSRAALKRSSTAAILERSEMSGSKPLWFGFGRSKRDAEQREGDSGDADADEVREGESKGAETRVDGSTLDLGHLESVFGHGAPRSHRRRRRGQPVRRRGARRCRSWTPRRARCTCCRRSARTTWRSRSRASS